MFANVGDILLRVIRLSGGGISVITYEVMGREDDDKHYDLKIKTIDGEDFNGLFHIGSTSNIPIGRFNDETGVEVGTEKSTDFFVCFDREKEKAIDTWRSYYRNKMVSVLMMQNNLNHRVKKIIASQLAQKHEK